MDKNQEKTKQAFANAWKKAADLGKKAAEETKKIVDQTKENIHEQKAKKYAVVTEKAFRSNEFLQPSVIRIEDDSANREFVEDADAIGWIEVHKDVQVLHMYFSFVKDCKLVFIPMLQRGEIYCQDPFDPSHFTNVNQVFKKSADEKLAELNNIAYRLGAKSCSVEIIEAESESKTSRYQATVKGDSVLSAGTNQSNAKKQSGKTITYFEGHDDPQKPDLKWFAYDENIKGLIEMRCNKAIKSKVLELNGASSATMSKTMACAIDELLKISGNISMEKKAIEEHSHKLLFEIEF